MFLRKKIIKEKHNRILKKQQHTFDCYHNMY